MGFISDCASTTMASKTLVSVFIALCVVISVLSISQWHKEERIKRSTAQDSEKEDSETETATEEKTGTKAVELVEVTLAKRGIISPKSRDLRGVFKYLNLMK